MSESIAPRSAIRQFPPAAAAPRWSLAARIAAALVLTGAFAAQLVNRALFDMSEGYASLFREITDNPVAANTAAIVGIFAPALLLGMVLILTSLTRRRSPVASWIALISGVLAFTCLPAIMGYSYSAFSLTRAGLDSPEVADALAQPGGPGGMVLFAVFSVTSLVSILSLAWALWRSRVTYRAAAVLLVLFMLSDISGLMPVDGHYLGLAAMILVSISLFTAKFPSTNGETTVTIES